ncbi:hypothetical protein J4462_01135 [Candidatus Pacearchaeota archaeon]|nr:hypothetical protein [Candidatus Pacearchaeota archaeon]
MTVMTFSTKYYGSTDIGDYTDSAKYLAGEYSAKIRNTHSYMYGFLLSPFVNLTHSFVIFKIFNLLLILGITYSIYLMCGKNKKILYLCILSPIFWYMSPWASPILLSSFLLLWAFYLIEKYEKSGRNFSLLFSGIFVGLSWTFWDTIFYLGLFLWIVYLCNKKLYSSTIFFGGILIGLLPRMIFDHIYFGFLFYTTLKTFFAGITHWLFGGIYNSESSYARGLLNYLLLFLAIPLSYWKVYKPEKFRNHRKAVVFITLSLLLFAINPQIRYIASIAPIMIYLTAKQIGESKFRKQIILSIVISLFFVLPYIIQINYNINNEIEWADITYLAEKKFKFDLSEEFIHNSIKDDLEEITDEYPDEVFLVGPHPDSYQVLADTYWGDHVKEFVSVQDYELWLNNESVLFEKKFMPVPKISDRRRIWFVGGISKNENDKTDYASIKYALSLNENLNLDGFKEIKKYRILTLWQKIDTV